MRDFLRWLPLRLLEVVGQTRLQTGRITRTELVWPFITVSVPEVSGPRV